MTYTLQVLDDSIKDVIDSKGAVHHVNTSGQFTTTDQSILKDLLAAGLVLIKATNKADGEYDAVSANSANVVNDLGFGSLSIATHSFGNNTVDWELSATEAMAGKIVTTLAANAVEVILPDGVVKMLHVENDSGYNNTVKYANSTGVAVADNKQTLLFADGSEVIEILGANGAY